MYKNYVFLYYNFSSTFAKIIMIYLLFPSYDKSKFLKYNCQMSVATNRSDFSQRNVRFSISVFCWITNELA